MSAYGALLQQAWQKHQSGDLAGAEAVYRSVMEDDPENADARVYLGIVLFDRRRFDLSVTQYRHAINLQHHFPVAWNNLGNSLRMLGEIDEAETCFSEALRQKPDYLSALKNRGTLWIWAGEIERGMQWYARGLEVEPHNAELHRNLGVIELLRGNYETGWREYRWRWKVPGLQRPPISAPSWSGEPLSGKRFLLYPEQGLGDAIHFVRVARALQDRGADVTLQCPQRMVDLFSSTIGTLGVDRLTIDTVPAPPVDYHASMIEAADVLFQETGKMPTGRSCFSEQAGYLRVSGALVDYWREWLDQNVPPNHSKQHPSGRRIRIGINWQGNPDHHADVYRSVPLSVLRPLADLPNVQLINLQLGYGSEQLDQHDFASSILRLPSHVDEEGAFTDTSAILANLDHVVTTDTAIAHLAGAMGCVPVHLMLGRVPDWRWLLEGKQTDWYPKMKLYRQTEFGCWDDVIGEIGDAIMALVNHSGL